MKNMRSGAICDGSNGSRPAIAGVYSRWRQAVNHESPERLGIALGPLRRWQRRRLSEYIEANLGGTLRVSDLGSIVRLSTAHFSRVFKRSFGRGPHAYIMQRRIESAMIRMLDGAQSLCDIAAECGFSDQSHLCREFRRRTGVSPSTWRQQRAGSSL